MLLACSPLHWTQKRNGGQILKEPISPVDLNLSRRKRLYLVPSQGSSWVQHIASPVQWCSFPACRREQSFGPKISIQRLSSLKFCRDRAPIRTFDREIQWKVGNGQFRRDRLGLDELSKAQTRNPTRNVVDPNEDRLEEYQDNAGVLFLLVLQKQMYSNN